MYENGIISTIAHTYINNEGKTVILLPIMHMGEHQYFQELLNFIGNKICIYEYLELGRSNFSKKPIKGQTFDEQLHQSALAANDFYQKYSPYIKKIQKKIQNRMIRKLKKTVKKNLDFLDERVTILVNIIERSLFGIQNITLAQMYLATLNDLGSQLIEMDYITDIPNRDNWIHSDLELQEVDDFDIEGYLISPNKELLMILQKQAILLYSLMYLIEEFCVIPPSERRKKFADWIYNSSKKSMSEYEHEIPDYIYHPRNEIIVNTIDQQVEKHDEIIIFYGSGHMPEIEKHILEKGYELHSKASFEVFRT